MNEETISTGIDIGTTTIKVVVSKFVRNENKIKLLAKTTSPSAGFRKGSVTNKESLKKAIYAAIKKTEEKIGQQIESVFISVGGSDLEYTVSDSSVVTTLGNGRVTDLDIEKAIEKTKQKVNTVNKIILEEINLGQKVDGKEIYSSPTGIMGKKLDMKRMYVTYPENMISDLEEIIDECGLDIDDTIPGLFASSCVTLSPIDRKSGCGLVDIGTESTSLIIFEEDVPNSIHSFNIGSNDITKEIALKLKVDIEKAERLKRGELTLAGKEKTKLDKIIKDKVKDIFTEVNKHLKETGKYKMLPAGLILIGGGSSLEGIEKMASDFTDLPCKRGRLQIISSNDPNQEKMTAAFGLCCLGVNKGKKTSSSEILKSFRKKIGEILKKIFI
jgi:cell division protein FtsA